MNEPDVKQQNTPAPGQPAPRRRKPASRLLIPLTAVGCLTLGITLVYTGPDEASQSVHTSAAAPSDALNNAPGSIAVQTIPANATNTPTPQGEVSFNRDIRPILSDRCFACHGPDSAVAKTSGGFRLDTRATATAPAESGDIPIVPGDVAASQLINRITNHNDNLRMPPPESNLSLNAAEIDLLRRWIEQGAEYEGHWAYQTPVRPDVPQINNTDWARNAVDHFIAARLEQQGLLPSAEADRQTLIRRLSLDLIGLPPTPEQIDAFINDPSPDAYEHLVDRLLASPHFGERMAIDWLDAARYADTNGFHHDNIRTAWPWRQWVIESFNDNMPYNEFVVEQLAGDLLPNATQQQVLASAFCRMHNINDEGGALDDEYIVEAIVDRIETVATVFMAQTFTCTRCHDHKYDPITQDDYYSTWAYFNSVNQEEGVYNQSFDNARAYPPRIMWTSEELRAQIDDAESRLTTAREELTATRPAIEQELRGWEQSFRETAGLSWANTQVTSVTSSNPGTQIEMKPDGSALLSGEVPANEDITITLRTDATNLRMLRLDALTDPSFHEQGLGRAQNGNAVLTQVVVQAVSVADPTQTQDVTFNWAWATRSQQNGDYDILNALRDDALGWAVGGHEDNAPRVAMFVADQPFGFEGGTELRVTLRHQSQHGQHTLGRVRVGVATANEQVLGAFPVTTGDWFEIGPYAGEGQEAFDTRYGPEDATRLNPNDPAIRGSQWVHKAEYTDGREREFRSGSNVFFFGRTIFSPTERQLNLELGRRSSLQIYLNGEEVHSLNTGHNRNRDNITITLRPGENTLVVKVTKSGPGYLYYLASAVGEEVPALQPLALVEQDLRPEQLLRQQINDWVDSSEISRSIAAIQRELEVLNDQAVPVLVMSERDVPVPAYILSRGAYDKPITTTTRTFGPFTTTLWPVEPQTRKPPAMIGLPIPEGEPNNRLGYARWLTRPDHPLTGRVQVNRIWRMLFGTGIVATAEDFGSQADWPSHLALLDYLSVDFVESGWDQKALIKQIVMSATYRQLAATNIAAREVDGGNRLLSYFPRRRLAGELIRDQALFVSGLLNDEIGGPSVRPYQPEGLWREVSIGGSSNTGRFTRDDGDDLYRRSMYTFWKRTSPPPQMATFNAPTREFCVVRRDITNTPLQVLTIWNDEQFLEAARVLAQRTIAEAQSDEDRLTLIFRRCTGRAPDAQALQILTDTLAYYRQRYAGAPDDAQALLQQGEYPLPDQYEAPEIASWMMIASSVLSLDETIVRD